MSSVFTPRPRRTSYSASVKSSPTGPTTRTSVKKLAASEKCVADPPSIRSRSPNGVRTASKAIDPTTTRLMRLGTLHSRGARARTRNDLQRRLGNGGLHRRPQEPLAAVAERPRGEPAHRPDSDGAVRGG